MSDKKNSELRDIIKSSKTKRDIERIAELIYDKKNTFKRKRVENNISSESSDEEEKNVTTEKKKKSPKKLMKYQKFVQEEHSKLKAKYDNEDIFKVIGDRWRSSPDNPKNV
ncbi:hypothetical protein F8M41_017371 [Gigaspora margarita]|uniref:Uncharacterized protein n=1 Tax=Gigaspora margarita TaxID=4874 RepID=A0A8H3WS15_GIGMA|nr:hypothetical protein F8M41_017371 [Gigaspora margarita]